MNILAFVKVFSILVTVAAGLLAIFGKTTTTAPDGKTRLTLTGYLSFLVVLLGGLVSYVSDRVEKETAATAARIDKEWDALQSSQITGIVIQPGVRNAYLKLVHIEDFATKISLQLIHSGSHEKRLIRVASDNSPDKSEILFSLSVTGDGIKEPLHSEGGKIWTEYPGSKQWLCYWAMKRPPISQDTWACSVELSFSNPTELGISTLFDLTDVATVHFSFPADFKYEARLFSTKSNMYAAFAVRVGETLFDISPRKDEFVEYLDETITPPVKRLEAEVTGHELLWRIRSQFYEYGGMPSAIEPKPFWWQIRFQIADWLDDVLPTWISRHLPHLYPTPPQVVERKIVGRPVNLYGYYPRPPNEEERAAFKKWIADHSSLDTSK